VVSKWTSYQKKSAMTLTIRVDPAIIASMDTDERVVELEQRLAKLESDVRKMDRTLYGIQQLFKKAAEYEGRDPMQRRLP
jgi:hypothetical protein